MKKPIKSYKSKSTNVFSNPKIIWQLLLLFLLCLSLYFAQAYQYVYYVVPGSRTAAILFLAAYHIIAFLYGLLFFKDARTALIFVSVTAFLILMGDYSGYAPASVLLHGLTSIKTAVATIGTLLIVYGLMRLIILIKK